MAHRLRRRAAPGLLLAYAIACSDPLSATCTRGDQGQPCPAGQSGSATLSGGVWTFTSYRTVETRREYEDRGHVCTYRVLSCQETHCQVHGAGHLTAQQAMAFC
jgi:hypothetical protein